MCFNYSMCWTACSSCSTTTSTWTMREGKISWTIIPAFQVRTSTGSTIIANILYSSSIYTTLGTDIWSSNVFKCLPWCTSARSRTTRTCSSTCTVFCYFSCSWASRTINNSWFITCIASCSWTIGSSSFFLTSCSCYSITCRYIPIIICILCKICSV